MNKELTIEELNEKLKTLLNKLEDKSTPLDQALEIYKEAALTLEECYKSLDKAKGQLLDVNEEIEKIRAGRGEL